MIYFVFAAAGRKQASGAPCCALCRHPAGTEHAVEVVGLVPPLLYFGVILLRESFGWIDAVVLLALYAGYLWARSALRPQRRQAERGAAVSRWAYRQRGAARAAIGDCCSRGGLLYATAHPFLESMLALAGLVGASQLCWSSGCAVSLRVPGEVSAFYWAGA